jgi:magnesium chelatase family protein
MAGRLRKSGAQRARYADDRIRTNAALTPTLMTTYCAADPAGARVLEAAVQRMALSARAYDRVRKVARPIADLAGSDAIRADHLAEALHFRMTT